MLLLISAALAFAAPAAALDPASATRSHTWRAPATPKHALADSIAYRARVMDGNLMGVTISNYGFIGNSFISRAPSMEYPLGAGYEHLVRGGLWIGGLARDENGTFTGVTTASVDGAEGHSGQAATEYTPGTNAIRLRSTLLSNDNYSPLAISELDAMSFFSDRPAKRNVEYTGEDHRPMGVIVRQDNYSWSFSKYQNILFFHYVIRNDGPPLQNVWIGIYTELASGAKKDYATWPPGGSWYRKKWVTVDDTLTVVDRTTGETRLIPPMVREHYCAASPLPDLCQLEVAPYWVGVKLLGSRRSQADTVEVKRPTIVGWGYAPFSDERNEDVERYELISRGTVQQLPDTLLPSTDPVELIAIGPFSQIDPGDSIEVDFALVGGREIADIQEHSRFAQRAYDRNYVIPVPPPPPNVRMVTRANGIDVYWDNSPEIATDPTSPVPQDFEGYRLYVGTDRLDLRRLAQFDLSGGFHDTTGFNTGLGAIAFDTTFADGAHYNYRYRIEDVRDGFKYFAAVTSYDIGTDEVESLESGISRNNKVMLVPGPSTGEQVAGDKVTVFPNPYVVEARWDQGALVRDHYLWFANLPSRANIKIYTLAGDRVFEKDFDGATYQGTDARGVYDPRRELDVGDVKLSGRSWAWNMITTEGQAAATGLYMYAVEDRDTGKRQTGRFLIVKSDREGY
jgi:hypothetical protein